MNPHNPSAPVPNVSPEKPFAFLWRGRLWILGASLLGAVLGTAYALSRGTVWRAQSVIFVSRAGPIDLRPDPATAEVLPRNYANTQAELLRSTPVLNAALGRPGVHGSPVFEDPGNELVWLKRKLDVGVGNEDDLITITLDSPLREEACIVVNAVVDSYRELRAGTERGTAAVVAERLRGELERSETELQAEQTKLLEFLKANPGVRLHAGTDVAASRLVQLHSALTEAEIDAVEAKATWRSAAQLASDPELLRQLPVLDAGDSLVSPRSESGDTMQIRDLRALRLQLLTQITADTTTRFRELQSRRLQLMTQLSPQHPAVAEIDRDLELLKARATSDDPTANLQQTIDELEQQANAGEAEYAAAFISALERRYQSAVERQDALQREIADQEQELVDLEPKQADYRLLETRLERARKLNDLLYERIAQLDVEEDPKDSDAAGADSLIFEYATPESAIVASSKSAVVAIATFLGAILGAIIVWIRVQIDQRLRTVDDVSALLPVLATTPAIEPSPEGAIATWNGNPEFAESMRSLRLALSYGARRTQSKAFQVGSAEPDVGKSLVAAGLGIAMAQAGQRTLIIDADFRRPEQARLFGVGGAVGLSQLLQPGGPAITPEETEVKGLHLLASGPLPHNLDELLGGPRLAATVKELARQFDCIVIDSPPLLMSTDGQVIATACDETLIVIRSGKTTGKLVRAALATIVSVGCRVSGAVLNRSSAAGLLGLSGRYAYKNRESKVSEVVVLSE